MMICGMVRDQALRLAKVQVVDVPADSDRNMLPRESTQSGAQRAVHVVMNRGAGLQHEHVGPWVVA